MEQHQLKEYLNKKELAEKLGVSERFIEDNTLARKIPGAVKIGRLWRYRVMDLEKALLRGVFLIEKQPQKAPFPPRRLIPRGAL